MWRTRNLRNLWRGVRRVKLAKALQSRPVRRACSSTMIRGDGEVVPFGLASLRVVTTAGVGYIVDAFQNIAELEDDAVPRVRHRRHRRNVTDTGIEPR